MDKLKGHRQRQRMLHIELRPAASSQQAQSRAQALASRLHQMRPHLGHQLHRSSHCRQQLLLQHLQIAFYHIKHMV